MKRKTDDLEPFIREAFEQNYRQLSRETGTRFRRP
jgi:hypothetical protein